MTSVPSKSLYTACLSAGLAHYQINLADADYICPTRSTITKNFAGRFENFLQDSGLARFDEEANDCDDFALHAHSCIKRDHARYGPRGVALGFGEAWFIGENGGHAVNCAFHINNEGDIELCLYEPQLMPNENATSFNLSVSMSVVPLSQVSRWLYLRA